MAEPLPSTLPELLAPAGSMEALRAAVSCGADAVYLGGRRFSARQYAENFDDREIGKAVDFAHGRGVRVYAAVNTLLLDREMADVARYLVFLSEIGVDAVLVQDPGLALLARELVPGLPLHASTQMTIHNRAGLEWASSLGMRRVVLARELPLGEVEAMGETARRLGIGLEIFAHGALCYSYSGQCLLSSAIGGRSGNRGRCAQPCRRPYTLVRGRTDPYGRPLRPAPVPLSDRYLLSTKDLSLYPYLDRVARAPVAALKIEGRMRSPEYVATVTGIYRKALDAIEQGAWSPSPADEEVLALTFNRGFTGGCLCEGPEAIMGRDAPDHRGVLIGIVEFPDAGSGSLGIRLSGQTLPEKGDGLVIRGAGRENEEWGLILRQRPVIDAGILWLPAPREARAEEGKRSGSGWEIRRGARVFITRRARPPAAAGCFSPDSSVPGGSRIRVDLALRVMGDGRPVLEGSVYRGGEPVTLIRREAGFAAETARVRELTGGEVREILSRRARSPYLTGVVRVDWPPGAHARKGDIGELRRDLLTEVEQHLVRSGRRGPEEMKRAGERLSRILGEEIPEAGSRRSGIPQTLVILTDTPEGVTGIAEEGSGYIALEPTPEIEVPPGDAGFSGLLEAAYAILREAAGIAGDTGWSLLWKWPRITGDPWIDGLSRIFSDREMDGISGLMVEGAGAGLAARSLFPGLPVHGGPGLNAWNARSVQVLSSAFRSITLSPELSGNDLRDLVSRGGRIPDPPLLGFPVEGNLEVMVSEDRLASLLPRPRSGPRGGRFVGIRDGTARTFPVGTDICGRTRILNAVETCLIDQLPALSSIGIGLLVIDARGRGPRYAREMAALYREAISLVESGGEGVSRGLGDLREECRRRARGGITRGNFLRGLREEDEEDAANALSRPSQISPV